MELSWDPTGGEVGRTLLIQVLLILKYACRGGMGCLIFQRWWTKGPSELQAINVHVVFTWGYMCVLTERSVAYRAVPTTEPGHACRNTEGWDVVGNTWSASGMRRYAVCAGPASAAVDGNARRCRYSASSVDTCFYIDRSPAHS